MTIKNRMFPFIVSSIAMILIILGLVFGESVFSLSAFIICCICFIFMPSTNVIYSLYALISFNTIFKN